MSQNNKIIGIITIPYDISSSYVSFEHIELLKYFKLEPYLIPYDITDYKYYFDRINGLYIPSGIISKGNIKKYEHLHREKLFNTCKEFIKLAIQSNNNNIIFPIWGTCFGMELLMEVIDKNITFSKVYSYPNHLLPLNPTKDGMLNSKIIKNMDEDILKHWMNNPIKIHNHGRGITPNNFKKSKLLNTMFNLVSIGVDKNGRHFVSLIEGKKYPFYGVQWHPELSKKTYIVFDVFVNDINKSKKQIKHDRKTIKYIIDTKICSEYSDGLYKKCLFYSKSPI